MKSSLDLNNNSLIDNLELFRKPSNKTQKNVILNHIYETEIKNKGYDIKYNKT
jgi:hypothetical protein